MAAFTLKATYRGLTRKIPLPNAQFPSYDQLCEQVRAPADPYPHSAGLTAAR